MLVDSHKECDNVKYSQVRLIEWEEHEERICVVSYGIGFLSCKAHDLLGLGFVTFMDQTFAC